jgi:hypothetical protein
MVNHDWAPDDCYILAAAREFELTSSDTIYGPRIVGRTEDFIRFVKHLKNVFRIRNSTDEPHASPSSRSVPADWDRSQVITGPITFQGTRDGP